ncbi:receptor-like protein kinase FERONIA [Vicia villosa]|uniref:receptor-like protein kinase FERONIA n=1 Tax=Vicia villosa TaxID=3911 RepID=UPI00273A8E0E|nr:receptor-like protein kinase FERONIA [Vicia villosa]
MKPLINFKTIITTLFYFSISLFPLQAYDPVDRYTLNCGTTGNSTDGERTWTGDTNSKLLLSSQNNNPTTISVPTTTQKPSINKIPYSTARLSHSIFNYSFPVTQGPKFLRLFFYPSTYSNGFNRYDASFTVVSNGFTLLKDFNASLNADVEGVDTLFKEYVINVGDDQRLDLSFIPSSGNSNSYAFINGIEVLSMPDDLYYTSSTDPGFSLVESTIIPAYTISTNVALETDYRIKVGVQANSPKIQDTGMLRNWNKYDTDYLRTPTSRDFVSGDLIGRNITVNPDYVAPKDLYRSSRDLGTNATLNHLLNLTWEFPLDSGFYYFIRLHFCELDPNITTVGDRLFTVYLQGNVAEIRADVMRWTQDQKGLAVHRNYAVIVPKSNNKGNKKVNLSIQMQPYADRRETVYSDPFLNGLEIFKISDVGSKNLAGPNPEPVQTPVQEKKKSKSISGTTILGVVLGVVFGIVLVSLVVFFVCRKKRQTKEEKATTTKDSKSSATSKWGPLSFATTKSSTTHNSNLPSDLCRSFSLVEIRAATNNFDELFIVGVGGFGHVYKGYLDNGSTPVAIKRLKPGSQQGENEFINEIDMLSNLRHLHLVSLIGYCNENNEMIIVYDFMMRGTLRDHLYNTENPALSWKQRLKISIGAARGLHYLHTGAKHTIIHRDVKTTNILLDEKWIAKVSDFGLSRIGPTGVTKAHVSTVVKGSVGYLDPEYYKRQRLTEKSDVYSFGVVLFEILCARPPIIRTAEKKQVSLADWGRLCYKSGALGSIVDPSVKWSIAPECLKKFGEIAVSCLLDDGTMRPSMNDVVWMLEFALQLQESAEQRDRVVVDGVVVGDDVEGGERRNKNDDDDDVFSSSGSNIGNVSDFNKSTEVSVSTMTGSSSGENSYGFNKESVFSEIVDPKAR